MSLADDPRRFQRGYYRRVEIALVAAAVAHVAVFWAAPPYVPRPYKLSSLPLRLVTSVIAGDAQVSETAPSVPGSVPIARERSTPVATEQLQVVAQPAASSGRVQVALEGISSEGESGPPVFYAFDSPPRITRRVYPEYAASARAQGAEGTVVVNANVDERGHIMRAWIAQARAPEALVRAALDAVYQFEFQPGSAHGFPVKCTVAIPFSFSLNSHL